MTFNNGMAQYLVESRAALPPPIPIPIPIQEIP
jgi:hypothetical protein